MTPLNLNLETSCAQDWIAQLQLYCYFVWNFYLYLFSYNRMEGWITLVVCIALLAFWQTIVCQMAILPLLLLLWELISISATWPGTRTRTIMRLTTRPPSPSPLRYKQFLECHTRKFKIIYILKKSNFFHIFSNFL